MHDAIVIGGGFYGAAIAIYLKKQRNFSRVALIERDKKLLARASYNNQARVHNGYHYPRSFVTAFRSRVNLPRFVRDFPLAVKRDFTKIYAIPRRNSKVTARQFERFCKEIGAAIEPAPAMFSALFDAKLIEQVFMVEEYAFDADILRNWACTELLECGIEVHLETHASGIFSTPGRDSLDVRYEASADGCRSLLARYVFNCAYSGLNQLDGNFPGTTTGLKHEIAEMALIKAPPVLENLGVTVMDGAFFSMMPFPARGLHTLSHVRYTPHLHWQDRFGVDPYQKLAGYAQATRVDRMMRDVARYMPAILDAEYVESLFEVKTILVKNEVDDGRPILFERHASLPRCYSILGGKIDNIFDVLEKLDAQVLSLD